jgi:hypothetical protein
MASMQFPTNKWTYRIAAVLCLIIWITTGSLIQAIVTTLIVFVSLYVLFIILAKLF